MVVMIVPVFVAAVGAVEMMFPTMMMVPVRVFAAMGKITVIAIAWIVVAIYKPMEMVGPVKPRSSPDEHTVGKPLGAIVAKRGAPVWRVVVITVWARRFRPNMDTEAYLRI